MNTEHLLKVLGRMAQPAASSGMLKLAGACLDDALLHSFRNGSLDETARSSAEAHLHVCEACTERLLTVSMALPELQSGNRRRILASAALGTRAGQEAHAWWKAPQWVGGLVAVAAVAMLVLRPSSESSAIPVYGLELTGQVAEVRGESVPSPDARFSADSVVVLRGFPEKGLPEAVPSAVIYAGGSSGPLQRVTEPFTRSNDPATGMVEVEIPVERLVQGGEGTFRVAMLLTFHPEEAPGGLDPSSFDARQDQLLVKTFHFSKAHP